MMFSQQSASRWILKDLDHNLNPHSFMKPFVVHTWSCHVQESWEVGHIGEEVIQMECPFDDDWILRNVEEDLKEWILGQCGFGNEQPSNPNPLCINTCGCWEVLKMEIGVITWRGDWKRSVQLIHTWSARVVVWSSWTIWMLDVSFQSWSRCPQSTPEGTNTLHLLQRSSNIAVLFPSWRKRPPWVPMIQHASPSQMKKSWIYCPYDLQCIVLFSRQVHPILPFCRSALRWRL